MVSNLVAIGSARIMKKFLLTLLLGIAIGSSSFSGQNKYERAQSETVLIEVGNGYGSGVIVRREGKTFVWTAAHVVKGFSSVTIHQSVHFNGHKSGDISFPGVVISRLENSDSALLWIDMPPAYFKPASWAPDKPLRVGDSIFGVGNMKHVFDNSVTLGIISQVGVNPGVEEWPWKDVDQATLPALPGVSGGPVFSSTGKVIGLFVGAWGTGVPSWFTPIREIEKEARKKGIDWAIRGWFCPTASELQKLADNEKIIPVALDLLSLSVGTKPETQ